MVKALKMVIDLTHPPQRAKTRYSPVKAAGQPRRLLFERPRTTPGARRVPARQGWVGAIRAIFSAFKAGTLT
jgi:hypothetical protein